jgi:hypothetical protein
MTTQPPKSPGRLPEGPVTPSGRYRAKHCVGSVVLPQVYTPSGPEAEYGTGVHDFAADVLTVGRDKALARVRGKVWEPTCEGFDPYRLPVDWDGERHVEVSYAYDVVAGTGRVLGYRLNRRYPPTRPSELKGTADLTLYHRGRSQVVGVDWKTGRSRDEYWTQVEVYLLKAARAHGADSAIGVLAYIDKDTGEVTAETREYDAIDLATVATELKREHEETAAARKAYAGGRGTLPPTHAGDWCKWCNAKPHCPEFGTAAMTLTVPTNFESWLDRVRVEIRTPEGYAKIRRTLTLFEEAAREIKEEGRQYVLERGEVDLDETTKVRAISGTRTTINGDVAVDVLGEHVGGREKAEALVEARGGIKRTPVTTVRQVKR